MEEPEFLDSLAAVCRFSVGWNTPTLGSQESGVRSQESGVRSQESGVRSQEIDDCTSPIEEPL